MRKRSLAILACVALSCGKLAELPTDPGAGAGEPIDPTATFTRVQNEVFTPTCAVLGCHDRLVRQQGLILAPGLAYANVVNVASTENAALMKVAPGDFANSYLYRKVIGVGITGDRMPQTGPALNDAQIKLIRDWIRRGAPND